jgi:hypothetical protein
MDFAKTPDYRRANGRYLIYHVPGIGYIVWDKMTQKEIENGVPVTALEADKFLEVNALNTLRPSEFESLKPVATDALRVFSFAFEDIRKIKLSPDSDDLVDIVVILHELEQVLRYFVYGDEVACITVRPKTARHLIDRDKVEIALHAPQTHGRYGEVIKSVVVDPAEASDFASSILLLMQAVKTTSL